MGLVKTYFSHDINSLADPKIAIMISLHGVISYAWWWMLLEKLAEAPDYKLPCNKFTYLGLSITMDIRPETLVFSKTLANASTCQDVLANPSGAMLLEALLNSLINDCDLLETDGEYFWSPGLLKRMKKIEAKKGEISEKRRQAGRLGGLAKSKNAKQNVANAKQNVASLANKIKENNIKENNIKSSSSHENEHIKIEKEENVLSMFEDEKKENIEPNKNVYKLYMNSIGVVSPVIKERLDDLIESYGAERIIVAINTSHEHSGNSIGYVERVAADNIRKEVARDNGTNQQRRGNSKPQKKDGSEVDWSKETGEWV